jgi:hypothetical protein
MERENDVAINSSLRIEEDLVPEETARAAGGREVERCSDGEALMLYE